MAEKAAAATGENYFFDTTGSACAALGAIGTDRSVHRAQ